VLRARLLAKARDDVPPDELGDPELQARAHDGHRRERAVRVVEGEECAQIDVGEPVGVRDADARLAQLGLEQLQAPARVGLHAGIDALDAYALRPALRVHEALDRASAVAGREQEARETLHRVELDHVPHDRHPADLDERLGDLPRALAQPRAAAATEDHDGRACRGLARAQRGVAKAV
jgi:hypothetical protein